VDNHCWKYKKVGVNYEKIFLLSIWLIAFVTETKRMNVVPLLPESLSRIYFGKGTKGWREKIGQCFYLNTTPSFGHPSSKRRG